MVVVAAHPDDETVGAGGRLDRLRHALFIYLTDGSPRDPTDALRAGCNSRESYATRRREELCDALRTAGIDPGRIHSLGSVDQEASFNLFPLTLECLELLRAADPDVVMTHPYEAGHPDHDAAAFVAHAACAKLSENRPSPAVIVEMTSYHAKDGNFESGVFLPADSTQTATAILSPAERDLKARLFQCYRSQAAVLQAFSLDVERFRFAPRYDFSRPPHEGTLYYETMNWGMSGEQWRDLARTALTELESE